MSDQESAHEVIEAYRRRRQKQMRPFLFGGIALVLVFVGIIVIIVYYSNPDGNLFSSFFASDTPTPTETYTATPVPPTATASNTSTVTLTPSITLTPTPEGPMIYIVQDGDSLNSIAAEFEIELYVLILWNLDVIDPVTLIIVPGMELLIPPPGSEAPTSTPLPDDLPRGFIIEYMVRPGDTLDTIAEQFNSTVDAILDENEDIENANAIFVGQIILVPVNLVTPTPTPTETPTETSTETATVPSP